MLTAAAAVTTATQVGHQNDRETCRIADSASSWSISARSCLTCCCSLESSAPLRCPRIIIHIIRPVPIGQARTAAGTPFMSLNEAKNGRAPTTWPLKVAQSARARGVLDIPEMSYDGDA